MDSVLQLKSYLDQAVEDYNSSSFIANDPVSIPHNFSRLQDIEISGLWTALLSWGQRVTIIKKARELFTLMDWAPYDFILNHSERDRKRFSEFKHRTFQYMDSLYFLEFLQRYYQKHTSLEQAFIPGYKDGGMVGALNGFHKVFFGLESAPVRTRKHLSCPAKKSSCKRINMFLRWMVRKDEKGVDFGLWNNISISHLMIPLDVHVGAVARHLGLLKRKQNDWTAVEELTSALKQFDSKDPVKYDYALFMLGVNKRMKERQYIV